VNALLERTEAVSIYQQTGAFQELGAAIDLPQELRRKLQAVAFGDEIGHPDCRAASQLETALAGWKGASDPLRQPLMDRLAGELHTLAEPDPAERLLRKANFAFDRRQYFKAVALLYEAVRVAACGWYGLPDPMDHGDRDEAEQRLLEGLKTAGRRSERRALWSLKNLRNSVLHGSDPASASRNEPDPLRSEKELKRVFTTARDVLYGLRAAGGVPS
jgi:hypothetical protein